MERTCYSCFWGGDGEEVDDCGHCYKHNGEVDFRQPAKNAGCGEWAPGLASLTNAHAILAMIKEDLTDWIISYDDGGDLGLLYCNPQRCACGEDATDLAICRRCIDEWLQQPYIGNYRMDDSQLVMIKEAGDP